MVAPLVVLADATSRQPVPEPCEPRRPAWWEGPDARPTRRDRGPDARPRRPTQDPRRLPVPAGAAGRPRRRFPCPRPQRRPPSRSRGRPTRPGCASLTASPAYQAQRQMVRKFAPEDAVVVTVLAALDRQGGAMTPAALARLAGVPALRDSTA